ncbi:putative endo-1,3(4)-beta-glucanase 2 [Panicum miliaceum]|uniref:glucan endo-1,3-beta-D-glucosidase n=1 Tax=Panicum miliaceum TaxID=4540 RepID=A0A3L6Q8X8_PANMI|nr:putative endo-1,3(4)-beta-glucanase 2 [Panicum miliaceum]
MRKWTKKLGHTLSRLLTSKPPFAFSRPRPTPPAPPPPPPVSSIPPQPPGLPPFPAPAMPHHGSHRPPAPAPGGHVFPRAASTVLPDPSRYFAPELLAAPLPTNSFFQNFALNNGDQPEYLHPYSVRSPGGAALDVCYPSRNHSPSFDIQTFVADLTVADAAGGAERHRIAAFDDLSVTLDVSPALRAHLVRGCPYVTVVTTAGPVDVSVASVHAFVDVAACDGAGTKWRLGMNSGQTFLLYASAPIRLAQAGTTRLSAPGFAGAIRVAYLPDASMEPVLDRYSGCFPTAGDAALSRPFCVDYSWRKAGHGELLMLAHPLHLRLLSDDCGARVLDNFRYRSIDGDLVGVVGDSWALRADPVSPTWHSTRGVSEDGVAEVAAALRADVAGLASAPITTTSSYFYGKAVARAARLALIAEEVGCPDAIPAVQSFLRATVTPWLDGSFQGNGFFYDAKWGGLVTLQGLRDSGADFGFGIYNDHHYHLGYFLYAIAVLAKIDPCWGRKHMPQAYSMVADFMTLSRNRAGGSFTRLRMFDLWKLHSWAGGLTEFADGRNQESTSEAVNAYYSAALVGLSYGDAHLVSLGATLTALEALAAQTWWHVRAGEGIYEEDFAAANRVVGVLWANKRDSGLWFAPPEWKECRLGIQLLPVLPISEALFPDVAFVRDLVAWTEPALARDGVGEGWKGFVYALEGIYDREAALAKTRALKGHDDGNSLTNLLWWLHSRGSVVGDAGFGRCCWYRQYCH